MVEIEVARLAKLEERQKALEIENRILREEVAYLKRHRFGRSTERLEPGQLRIFEEGELVAAPAEDPVAAPREPKAKKPGKHGRNPFGAHLPREMHELDLPEGERFCSCCQEPLQAIGEDVTERGHFVPAKLIVRRYERKKYACPYGHEVKSAPLPPGVVDRAKYEASVYADVAVSKYCDHLPLHRLEKIYKRRGAAITKQLMWDMLVTLDELVARPILAQMKAELLEEEVLHADESPVKVRFEGERGSKDSWVWGWRNLQEEETSKVLIDFQTSRGRAGPAALLESWNGTLITDGYSVYQPVCDANSIVRAGCWAHARRYFKQALDGGSRDAVEPLRLINRLFWLERAVKARGASRGLDRDGVRELRADVRKRRSKVLLEQIQTVTHELDSKASTMPQSKLGKAVTYVRNQARALATFVTDPRIPMHNNDQERDLRHIVIGRKNWLIFASPKGGEIACRMYSLMLSCLQNGVQPHAYLEHVLTASHTTKATDIATLTPWAYRDELAAAAAAAS